MKFSQSKCRPLSLIYSVAVQAAHNENSSGNQINREYLREYVLPDWVDVDHLRAKMSEDSTLTVEVPIPHDRVPAFNRQIKITQ